MEQEKNIQLQSNTVHITSDYSHRMFLLMIEVAIYFIVPAGIAIGIAKIIEKYSNIAFKPLVYGLLVIAFMSSWGIVIFRMISLAKKTNKNKN